MQGCLPTTAVGQLICECWFFLRDRHISHWIISIIMIVWISNIRNGKIEPHFTLHRYHKLNSDRALAEWLWSNVIRIPSNNQWISQPSILETDPQYNMRTHYKLMLDIYLFTCGCRGHRLEIKLSREILCTSSGYGEILRPVTESTPSLSLVFPRERFHSKVQLAVYRSSLSNSIKQTSVRHVNSCVIQVWT